LPALPFSAASTIEMPAVPPQTWRMVSAGPRDALLAQQHPVPAEDQRAATQRGHAATSCRFCASSSDTLPGRLSYAVSGLRSLLRRPTQLIGRLRGELGERLWRPMTERWCSSASWPIPNTSSFC
jgi:hypothetical protein